MQIQPVILSIFNSKKTNYRLILSNVRRGKVVTVIKVSVHSQSNPTFESTLGRKMSVALLIFWVETAYTKIETET